MEDLDAPISSGAEYDFSYELKLHRLSKRTNYQTEALQKKINAIAEKYQEDRLYVSALLLSFFDTVLVEKEQDIEDAIKMLKLISDSYFLKATIKPQQTELTIVLSTEIDVNHLYFLLKKLVNHLQGE